VRKAPRDVASNGLAGYSIEIQGGPANAAAEVAIVSTAASVKEWSRVRFIVIS
jgi:hypothetical protein